MRQWDLTTGVARLEQAFEELRNVRNEVSLWWDDQTYRQIQDEYFVPLEPMVRRALEAIRHLDEVLSQAYRDCEDA